MLTKKQIEVLSKICSKDGFEYFSGNSESSGNFPTIYHCSDGFVVVGPRVSILCETLDEAVEVYKERFKDLITKHTSKA